MQQGLNKQEFDFDALPQVVAVVGSRDFPHLHWVRSFVDRLRPTTIVVSGGARGVDQAAETQAKKRQAEKKDVFFKPFEVEDFEWTQLGKGVGHVRNELLVRWVLKFKGCVAIFALLDAKGNLRGGSKNVKEWCETLHVDHVIFSVTENANERVRILRRGHGGD